MRRVSEKNVRGVRDWLSAPGRVTKESSTVSETAGARLTRRTKCADADCCETPRERRGNAMQRHYRVLYGASVPRSPLTFPPHPRDSFVRCVLLLSPCRRRDRDRRPRVVPRWTLFARACSYSVASANASQAVEIAPSVPRAGRGDLHSAHALLTIFLL